jgi:hypothetical protein
MQPQKLASTTEVDVVYRNAARSLKSVQKLLQFLPLFS